MSATVIKNHQTSNNIRLHVGAAQAFMIACSDAGVKMTHRQWRKWNQGRGAAWNARKQS